MKALTITLIVTVVIVLLVGTLAIAYESGYWIGHAAAAEQALTHAPEATGAKPEQ